MTAIGRATVVYPATVDDDDPITVGWMLLFITLGSLLPAAILLGLIVGGLALAGALGVG